MEGSRSGPRALLILPPLDDLRVESQRRRVGARNMVLPGEALLIAQRPQQPDYRAEAQARTEKTQQPMLAFKRRAVERGEPEVRPAHPRRLRSRHRPDQAISHPDQR